MELIHWRTVTRKRSKKIPYTSPEFVHGYDIDSADFTALVTQYNANQLDHREEERLYDYVRTVMQIVLENPKKFNPRSAEEKDALTDAMFVAMWGAMKYVKDGKDPYSYVYRCGYTAGCTFYRKLYAERAKEQAIAEHLDSCYLDWEAEVKNPKVCTPPPAF